MQRFFQQRLLPEFFRLPFDGEQERLLLLAGMLAPASMVQLQRRLDELSEEFDRLLAQDAVLTAAQRQGVSLVVGTRGWLQPMFARLRRDETSAEGASSGHNL